MYSEDDEYEDNGSDLNDFIVNDNDEKEYIGTSDEDEEVGNYVEEFYEEEEFNEDNFEVYPF
jgi:hypothetical protein